MSIRNIQKNVGPVLSLVKSEHAQRWQISRMPEDSNPDTWRAVRNGPPVRRSEQSIRRLAETMVQEYNWTKDLSDAENGLFNFTPELAHGQVLLKDVVSYYRFSSIGRSKNFVLKCTSEPVFLMTDVILFRRVVGELLKNALEASEDHQTVTVACRTAGTEVEIAIHNEGVIPEFIRGNVFRHSVSTKGPGRGYGTYCAKLFGERYLRGKVSFRSTASEGTTFRIRLLRIDFGESVREPLNRELVLLER